VASPERHLSLRNHPVSPLTVCCFKWKTPGYRSTFGPETVRTLKSMVGRHYPHPHRFVCITDDTTGLDTIETVPLWNDYADLPAPTGPRNPSCYRRLKLFDPAIRNILGERFVSLDLDCVLLADLTPLWHRPEDFVMWGDTNPKTHYNGSMVLMTAGARKQVWESFDRRLSPTAAMRAGHFGSDQGWISFCLGPGEARWTKADGVYSYRNDIAPSGRLPGDARAVFFHGRHDPWADDVRRTQTWIDAHYR